MDAFFKLLANVRTDGTFYERKVLLLTLTVNRDPQFDELKRDQEYQTAYALFFNHCAALIACSEEERESFLGVRDRAGNKLIGMIETFIDDHEITTITIGSKAVRKLLEASVVEPKRRLRRTASVH